MTEDSRKLFVAGLPDSVSEDVLRQLFEATGGTVAEVSLPKDRTTGRPRGFGFVTMSTQEEATAAREALHGSFQGGRSISVRPFESAPPKREAGAGPISAGGPRSAGPQVESPDRKIYVGNLPYDATPEEVEAVVNATGAGPVVRVIMPSDPDGRKRGFAFAYMPSADSAKAALDLLRGAEVRGRRLVINPAHDRPPPGDRASGGYGGPPSGPRPEFGGGPPQFGGGGGGFPPREFSPPPREFGPPAPPGGGGDRRGGANAGAARKLSDDKRKRAGGDGGIRQKRNKNDFSRDADDD